MMKMLSKKRKGGFTLIELIVVIAILGILALIAIPRFAGFTDKAKLAADEQYGALIGNSVVVLLAENQISTGGTITIATDGTFTVGAGGFAAGKGVALAANDARITALVTPKALQGTATVVVVITTDGVVTVN